MLPSAGRNESRTKESEYPLLTTSVIPGATTFAATFGTDGVLEGRFFGPRAVDVAVRAKGGGQGFAAVTGIMTGRCSSPRAPG